MAKKILIIEDENHVAEYLQDIFQDQGYETLIAASSAEGLEMAASHRPDLITLDLQMPAEHGTRFYQRFRKDEDLKGIPIVVITGQHSPHRSINPDKVAAMVVKPFEPGELVAIVQKALGEE
ncbi:MAG: response regulator [Proteobacteria bacterium]|nr:response regulator [Pseudomonadota bacterium]MBU1451506.1 response regulator [Pseudomonadota bacterium]MBU2470459.1 response regulator [Pseudomonadota bacterium]MBU2519020.1 response regulator [Pseudomonadota bacterium]